MVLEVGSINSVRWEAGPKPVDGLWAPWCLASVPFPFSFYHLLEQSLSLYNMLQRHVKKKSSLLTPPLPPPDLPVPANEKLLAWVGDEIEPRESAKKA
ncbi:hypothetical protein K1719_002369 [Acacia pycnantha]|nr:hypothetical protein K1719_002369 [Acacia pycnantha]